MDNLTDQAIKEIFKNCSDARMYDGSTDGSYIIYDFDTFKKALTKCAKYSHNLIYHKRKK